MFTRALVTGGISSSRPQFRRITATGGSISSYSDGTNTYTIHTFTSSGTFTITAGADTVEYLVVAGGGAGGGTQNNASSPGYGGETLLSSFAGSTNSYTISVGAGGPGAYWNAKPAGGNPSSIVGGGVSISAQGGQGGVATMYSGGGYAVYPDPGYTGGPTTVTFPAATSKTYGSTGPTRSLNSGYSNGAANTGNGGSNTWSNANTRGGSGGSGIVIVRYIT